MVEIKGADPRYERQIREVLSRLPSWYVKAARINLIRVSRRADVMEQMAMYEHEGRVLYLAPNAGAALTKALTHELAHGCDDIFDTPHYFSTQPAWVAAHQHQPHFPLPKYRDEALEHFADVVAKAFLWAPQKLQIYYPAEAQFIYGEVFPVLMREFKAGDSQ